MSGEENDLDCDGVQARDLASVRKIFCTMGADMKSFCVGSLLLLIFAAGCGPQFALPETKDRPAQIVVSAYTQNGCLEELQEAANRAGVEVRLKDVQTDLGWEIFLFPFYKGYKCIGEVTGPVRR
jgi:hypothetical protein